MEVEIFYPKNVNAWRTWLKKKHQAKQAVWLVFYNKKSSKPSLTWSEAVDAALCYGWIDSKKISIDEERSLQFFTKRKDKSTWSKINKDKVSRLIATGQMEEAGLKAIEVAKQNGSWSMLDDVEALVIPKDLAQAFKSRPGSKAYFLSVSKSAKKMMLQWIMLAKRPETRQKRIDEIATHAALKQKPPQFR